MLKSMFCKKTRQNSEECIVKKPVILLALLNYFFLRKIQTRYLISERNPFPVNGHVLNWPNILTERNKEEIGCTKFSAPGRFPLLARLTASSRLFNYKV